MQNGLSSFRRLLNERDSCDLLWCSVRQGGLGLYLVILLTCKGSCTLVSFLAFLSFFWGGGGGLRRGKRLLPFVKISHRFSVLKYVSCSHVEFSCQGTRTNTTNAICFVFMLHSTSSALRHVESSEDPGAEVLENHHGDRDVKWTQRKFSNDLWSFSLIYLNRSNFNMNFLKKWTSNTVIIIIINNNQTKYNIFGLTRLWNMLPEFCCP